MEWPFHVYDPDTLKTWGRRAAVLAVLALVIYWWVREPKAAWEGLAAPDLPEQTSNDLPSSFEHEGYTITPLAHYSVTAVVLARERYRFDAMAEICPVDLGLGWGSMSSAERINLMKFSQSFRFIHWYVSGENMPKLKLSLSAVKDHAANTHCVPATPEVRKALLRVRRHELVTLKGYLIKAANSENTFTSSLTRTDSGSGACEVIYVTHVENEKI